MGVRPPSNDVDAEPDVIEFGIAALDARLEERDVSYPISAEEFEEQYGHLDVPYDASGHSTTVSEALVDVSVQRFDSQQELLNTLHPVFERKRQATSRSLLAQLRSLVPF